MEREVFGEKITALRKERGLTQKELAEQLNVTDKAVSKWERGINFPDITLLRPLADCLGVPVTQLLTEAEDPAEQSTKIIESCIAVAQEETSREKWLSFFKGMVVPLVLLAINAFFVVSTFRSQLEDQIVRAPVYFESPSAIVQKLGQGLDMSFAQSSKSESAEGQTLEMEFDHHYLCGSSQPTTFRLEDGEITCRAKIKFGEAKLMLLNAKGEICYFEPLQEEEQKIPLPNGDYQLSICGYWFSGDVFFVANEREELPEKA